MRLRLIDHLISENEERMNTCQVEQTDDQGQDLWLQIKRIDQHLTRVSLEAENGIKRRGRHMDSTHHSM